MPDLEFERIELNAIPSGDMPVFHASQYETKRPFISDLKWGEADFAPGEGCWCTLSIRKTDDTLVIIDEMDIVTNEVSCVLPQQAVACVGDNFCQLKVWSEEDGEDGCIACLNFILHVQPDPEAGGLTSESEIQNLENQIAEIVPEVIGNDYYNKTETDALLATKADASDLPDMTQYYTKTATDTLLNNKADKSDTYTKAQIDSALALKANQATTYTKTETDTLLDDKVGKFQLDSAIPLGDVYAAQVEQAFDSDIGFYDKVSNRALDVYTKQQVDNIILDIMPVGTSSGAVANFNTALTLPMVNVSCDIVATGGNGIPDNPNPINGYSSANITRCGVNLWDFTDTTVSGSVSNYYFQFPSKTYTLSFELENATYQNGGAALFDFYNADGTNFAYPTPNILKRASDNATMSSLAQPLNDRFYFTFTNSLSRIRLNFVTSGYGQWSGKIKNVTLTEGTDTTYHAYNGSTVTIAFGQTVYGGVLDVTRGKLHVTHGYVDLGSLSWTKQDTVNSHWRFRTTISGIKNADTASSIADILCEAYPKGSANSTWGSGTPVIAVNNGYDTVFIVNESYSDATSFEASLDGIHLAYELATPFDIDLTPEVISAIVGENNVYSDTNGDTTVQYKDSIQHYIDTRV